MVNRIDIFLLISMLVILGLDLVSPLGVAAGTPYGLVVFATIWTKRINETYIVAIAGISFTVLGYFLSPSIVSAMHAVIINRVLAVVIIVASALLVIRHKKAHKHIEDLDILSTTDPLTGVKNRLAFDRLMKEELVRDVRYKRGFSLAIIDIDNLKKINDSYGHIKGDKILKDVASAISKSVRKTDSVCRLGGDEFAIIFIETDIEQAKSIVETISNKISKNIKLKDFEVTVSIGVAMLDDKDTLDTIYNRADGALYLSKNQGRNRISVVSDTAVSK